MDILQYINKMNRLYGNDTQLAAFGTQDTYGAPEELSPTPNWRDLIREEGVQVGPQVKMDRDLNIKTAGLAEEYYGPQKLDWMENYPDLSWEEYLRYKSSRSFNQGGRVGFQKGTIKPVLNDQESFLEWTQENIGKEAKGSKFLGTAWDAVSDPIKSGFGGEYDARKVFPDLDLVSQTALNVLAPWGEKAFDILSLIHI